MRRKRVQSKIIKNEKDFKGLREQAEAFTASVQKAKPIDATSIIKARINEKSKYHKLDVPKSRSEIERDNIEKFQSILKDIPKIEGETKEEQRIRVIKTLENQGIKVVAKNAHSMDAPEGVE